MTLVHSRWFAADGFLEIYEDSLTAIQFVFGCSADNVVTHIVPSTAAACWQVLDCGASQILPGSGTGLLTAAAPLVVPRWPDGESEARASSSLVEVKEETSRLASFFPGFKWDSSLVLFSGLQVLGHCTIMALTSGSIPSACLLYAAGAGWGPALAAGEVWRLITPIFLHGSNAHLITNILFQGRLGFGVESGLGSGRFAVLYLASGALGNLFSAALSPIKLSVGASTSVMGIIGAMAAPTIVKMCTNKPHNKMMLQTPLIILLLSNISDSADRIGHFSSFVVGILLTPILAPHLITEEGATLRPAEPVRQDPAEQVGQDPVADVVTRTALGALVLGSALACAQLHYHVPHEHMGFPISECHESLGLLQNIQKHLVARE